ncbi:MAG: polysaccharide deacetylase family protein [Chitinophagales bacterium]
MILLNFDIEEFDVPIEYGKEISFEEQIRVSREGTCVVLDILKEYNIRATFFCTVVFAHHALDIIERIVQEGHEIASHGYAHSTFKKSDLHLSKEALEMLTGTPVKGFRMTRMQYIEPSEVRLAGYTYNSSINPTYLPGRYNYYGKPRTCFIENDVLQIPASVTPLGRLPLFWLSFHNMPFSLYIWLTKVTYRNDKYINVYFHPWEFMDLSEKRYGIPFYIVNNSGSKMASRFRSYLNALVEEGLEFCTFSDFISKYSLHKPLTHDVKVNI